MRNISFIIITPMLGYKRGHKKYIDIDILQDKIEKIKSSFISPDIVVVTGLYNKEYLKVKKNFRIIENQLPFDTGEIEQIRIALNNIINKKIVILKQECYLDCNNIKNGIKKYKKFVIYGNNENNPGMIIQDNLVCNISFGLKNNFGDMLYINGDDDIRDFIEKPHNRNKKLHELVNYLINIEPVRIL
jgi:hypothetical protein